MERPASTADALLAARRDRRPFASLPADAIPRSMDEAYAAQELVVRELLAEQGGRIIGYKVGATNPNAQRLLKVEAPFFGLMLSSSTFPGPAALPSDRFTVRCIEAEFGIEIGEDLPPSDRPYTRESVAGSIAAVMPALELVDHRFVDWTAVGAWSLVADNAIHGAWIEGSPADDWRNLDLARHPVTLSANGQTIGSGSGADVLGHPFNVVAWLANELPRHGQYLRRGDKITTGSAAPVYMANPGDRVTADFGALGRVELTFTP